MYVDTGDSMTQGCQLSIAVTRVEPCMTLSANANDGVLSTDPPPACVPSQTRLDHTRCT